MKELNQLEIKMVSGGSNGAGMAAAGLGAAIGYLACTYVLPVLVVGGLLVVGYSVYNN